MDYALINNKILETFIRGNIQSFPFDCECIIRELGFNVHKYSELSETKRTYCLMVSDESLKLLDNIYYNDNMAVQRIRFSLAHELGHIVLDHGDYLDPKKEAEANYFASCFLAPRMAIHYARCKNQNDVAKIFNLSQEAALYAFNDYRRWHRRTSIYKMNMLDKAMYQHFYNEEQKCFVYNIKKCAYCDSEIYNSSNITCKKCDKISYIRPVYDQDLMIAESNWLYGGL